MDGQRDEDTGRSLTEDIFVACRYLPVMFARYYVVQSLLDAIMQFAHFSIVIDLTIRLVTAAVEHFPLATMCLGAILVRSYACLTAN